MPALTARHEVQVVHAHGGVHDAGDGLFTRAADGPRRQALVAIGVVGRFDTQVLEREPGPGPATERVSHRGIGLQQHAAFQTIQVHACDVRALLLGA